MTGWAAWSTILLLTLPILSAGCFLGYDSRWGQQKLAQQHAAQRSTPKPLPTARAGDDRVARRVLRVRAYATPGYAASVVDWQKQLAELIEQANAILRPEFDAQLELADLATFPNPASEDKLAGLLQQLGALDPASDVDWVVGLAVAVPRFAASPDELGIAPLLGRHIVLRAMSDAHEYEVITRNFSELSEDERRKLYHVRKQHKLCVTFLHELAHTLGVPHELSAQSLMNPSYHVEASDFSDEAAQIIRASLANRASPASPVLDSALASRLDAWLRAPDSAWEPASRDAELQKLAQFLSTRASTARLTPSPSKPPATQSAPIPSTVQGLSPEEQQSFDTARADLGAGHAAQARELAAPLFEKHASIPALQSLRCDIAMAIGGDWETISAECPGQSPFGGSK
jgi:hypothetical protein